MKTLLDAMIHARADVLADTGHVPVEWTLHIEIRPFLIEQANELGLFKAAVAPGEHDLFMCAPVRWMYHSDPKVSLRTAAGDTLVVRPKVERAVDVAAIASLPLPRPVCDCDPPKPAVPPERHPTHRYLRCMACYGWARLL